MEVQYYNNPEVLVGLNQVKKEVVLRSKNINEFEQPKVNQSGSLDEAKEMLRDCEKMNINIIGELNRQNIKLQGQIEKTNKIGDLLEKGMEMTQNMISKINENKRAFWIYSIIGSILALLVFYVKFK